MIVPISIFIRKFTLQRYKKHDREVHVNNRVKGDEGDHGGTTHADYAFTVVHFCDATSLDVIKAHIPSRTCQTYKTKFRMTTAI